MKSVIQNSMDLLQKCLHFEALTDVYILKPHLNLTYLLLKQEYLQQPLSDTGLNGMPTTAFQSLTVG